MKKIGEKIAEARRRLGMSQQELADKIGVSRQTISRWEQGVGKSINQEVLEKLSRILQTPIPVLLGNSTEPHITTDIIFVPVMSNINTVCCGEGNIYDIPEEAIEYMIPVAVSGTC